MSDALITLRPCTAEDLPFLRQVYASTREDELALTNWTPAEKDAFVAMQFEAQHRYYHEHYADAEYLVIVADEKPVGRLYIHRQADSIAIIDIALLSEARNRGLGSALLRDVLAEGERAGKPVRIYVEKFNRALRLYERLGFTPIGEFGLYFHLEWRVQVAGSRGFY